MHTQGYFLLALAIPNLVLGSFILLRNTRDLTNIFFGSFILAAALWSLGLAGYVFTSSGESALVWAKQYYTAAALIPVFFLGFCVSFTGNRAKVKNYHTLCVLTLLTGILVTIFYNGWLIEGIRYHEWGKEVILNHSGYAAYSVYFTILVISGFLIIYRSLKTARGLYKTYLKFLFVGLAFAFFMGTAFNLFLPALGNYQYIWIGPYSTLIYISAVSYSIIKHKLFDIRSVAIRTFAYTWTLAVTGCLITVPILLLTNNLLDSRLSHASIVALALLTLFVAIVFQLIRPYFNRISNRLFYRDYYDPQAVLDELSNVLVGSVIVEDIKNKSTAILRDSLKPEFVRFYLKSDNSQGLPRELMGVLSKSSKDVVLLDETSQSRKPRLHKLMIDNNVALAARLYTRHSELGFITLGYKRSGAAYMEADKKLMSIVADEIAVGLQNALRFEEIRRFNETLQQKVDEATVQLRHANKRLKELDQTKDEFISMASHQLRTPLTTIKGYLSMVLEGDVGPVSKNEKQMIQQAFDSAERMVFLIADLLNVSRLQSGKFVIENKPTDLAKMVEAEVAQLQETAKNHHLTLTYKKPEKFPMLNLDDTKVRQVIMNFIDNAIYYTPAGGSIEVSLDVTDKELIFTVTDTGLGVPKEAQHHLFSKFYRAGNARKMRPDGTGLGLFMAKKVITTQGGAVIFNSVEGKGSTFGFSFPRHKVELKVPAPSKKPEPAALAV